MDGPSHFARAPRDVPMRGFLVSDLKGFVAAAQERAELLEAQLVDLRDRKSSAEAALEQSAATQARLGAAWVAAHRDVDVIRASADAEAQRIREQAQGEAAATLAGAEVARESP
jgi:cell division septum initiation protein DivIVA